MNVSLLSQDDFKNTVCQLRLGIRQTEFGTEISLWNEGTLYALGFGEVSQVKSNLQSQLPSIQSYGEVGLVPQSPKAIALVGTPFQHKVWKALMQIPQGKKVTYQFIAEKVGNPKAVRAVGTAIGRNPISLYVPCHRVIRQDGHMGGYRWGLDIKEKLLHSEAGQ